MAKRARILAPFKVSDCGLTSIHLSPDPSSAVECHILHYQLNGISNDVMVDELEDNGNVDICTCLKCYPKSVQDTMEYPICWDFNLDLTSKILEREIINE